MILDTWPRLANTSFGALFLILAALGAAGPLSAQPVENAWEICASRTTAAERGHGLPSHLLTAISKVESGRWHAESAEILAWPWTVTSGGKGRFLPSKQAAIAEVERLRARGVRNIDVGCMQINLYHHARAFGSLDEAFDPDRNVAYALNFLLDLKQRWGSWTRAMGSYHSNTPSLSGRYRTKVFRAIYAEKRQAAKSRRAARLAARAVRRTAAHSRTTAVAPPRHAVRP